MHSKWPAAGMVAAALALDAASASGQVSYTVTDLGTLGGSITVATAVNSSGQVVGWASIPGDDAYVRHPFLWDRGTMQDLGLLPGYRQCRATAINDGGQVVGWCAYPPGPYLERAFMWSAGSGIVDLGLPDNTEALGMNNHGDVVGFASRDAFVLYSDGVFSDLGPGVAFAINDLGQIVGWTAAPRPASQRATVWDSSGAHDLGALTDPEPSAYSDAYAINAYGKVVGRSSAGDPAPDGHDQEHAVLWDANGTGNLGTLGGTSAWATAISGELIVGFSDTTPGPNSDIHAFLYDNNGPGYPVDLNSVISPDAGMALNYATGINGSGQIVGWGCLSPSGGRVCGYLLTPVIPSAPPQ
jgi:probable HAF family extracellular repeat protein